MTRPGWGMFLLGAALAAVSVWAWKERQQRQQVQAVVETAEAQFKRLGNAYQAQGHVVDYDELARRVKAAMGPQVARQGAALTELVEAVGHVRASQNQAAPVPLTPTAAPSTFQATLPQLRTGPSLTTAQVLFDPTARTATATWQNHQENFTVSFAGWRTEHDGLRAAARLQRDVRSQAGEVIGREDIPLVSCDAYLSPQEVLRAAPVPKWDFGTGMSVDPRSGVRRPALYVGRYLNQEWKISTGYINGGAFVIASRTFGRQ